MLDGVLVVDKPAGPTSHDVVDHVRRSLQTRRAGHTGSTPVANGSSVPVCPARRWRRLRRT